MRAWTGRIFLMIALAVLGYGVIQFAFPAPAKVIRRHLAGLARTVSFDANEGALAGLASSQKVGSYFADEVEVLIDVPNRGSQTLTSRDELVHAAAGARSQVPSLHVEFPDIDVLVGPDKQTATAAVTLRAFVGGQRENFVQELRFTLSKVQGDWLIRKVETVRTLQ